MVGTAGASSAQTAYARGPDQGNCLSCAVVELAALGCIDPPNFSCISRIGEVSECRDLLTPDDLLEKDGKLYLLVREPKTQHRGAVFNTLPPMGFPRSPSSSPQSSKAWTVDQSCMEAPLQCAGGDGT